MQPKRLKGHNNLFPIILKNFKWKSCNPWNDIFNNASYVQIDFSGRESNY